MNESTPRWAREDFWRKVAIWVTGGMFMILIILTFDSIAVITAGSDRVPGYDVINRRIYYRPDDERGYLVPVIGDEAPLFGQSLTETQAADLVDHGKLTLQAKNCMNCHTLLGNGAYFAPDLTKAWLDPAWGNEASREVMMVRFLMDPQANARGYGTRRKMPNLGITEAEARALVAYLKWMSAIDTTGFPAQFPAMAQEGDR